jgi:hypothetical protein
MKYSQLMLVLGRWPIYLAAAALVACGDGGRDPLLGADGVATRAPRVTGVAPADGTTSVPTTTASLSVTFSEPVAADTGVTNLAVTCAAPCINPAGTVALAAGGMTATFSFTPGASLFPLVRYAIAVDGYHSVASNLPLEARFTSAFTTGASADTTPPTVSATSPQPGATNTAINALVTASFSEALNPASITPASFTLACPGGTAIGGTVGYLAAGNVATFAPTAALPAGTLCTATLGTAVRDASNIAMASAFTWSFTTGVTADTTAPSVSATQPAANATGVAVNTLVTATFNEAMNPLSLTATTFKLECPAGTAVTGTVGYATSGSVATLAPQSGLPASTVCTATLGTGVRDSANNALASPFTWTFTTGAAADVLAPTVLNSNPVNTALGVCVNKTISATFSEPMDPLTITSATFTLAVTAGAPVPGVIAYDAQTRIATFNPGADLTGTPATNYTATLRGGSTGVKDLAGNALATDSVTQFTTNASTCTGAPALGAAAPFGAFGGLSTLTNDGLNTVINGDIGVGAASTTVTGLHDSGGNVYTITPGNNGLVNGLVYTLTAPPGSVAGAVVAQARADALVAFNSISPGSLAGGIDVSSLAQCPSCGGAGGGADELAGRVLPPGVYLSTTGTYDIGGVGRTTADLVLDAGGDSNAVWVFQTAAGSGSLNVGLTGPATPAVPIHVQLINGAQPRNVFWYVPAGAVIGTGSTVVGTLLADASITMSTTGGSPPNAVTTTINGRAIALTAGTTMTNTVINVPAP